MKTLRLGSVPYLNAKPVVSMLEPGGPGPGRPDVDVRLVEVVPSQLAVLLQRGELDAAFVSSVVPLSDPSLCISSRAAVISDGPVLSIRLFSRVPVRQIRRLALDTSSRTGITLGRVMLARAYGIQPEIVSLPPDVPAMLEQADAGLVIGDPAMQASVAAERGDLKNVAEDLDLGSLWRSEIGLPFVYAVWASPRTADVRLLSDVLDRAADWGVARRDEIAVREAPRLGLPEDLCRRYLRENIYYDLGPREWEGLRRFHAYAVELGILPARTNPLDCMEAPETESASRS